MFGWEEVERDQVAIVLRGSPPLRAIACLIDLILRHQLDIQLCPVGTLTPYLIFKNQYFGGVPQGAEIPPEAHIDKIQYYFCLLSVEKVKQALEILNSSPSNRMFGGANLMISASRSLAHGLLLVEKKTYAPFNPLDFSLPPSYSTEERIDAEKVFDCQSLLQPSKSTEFVRSPERQTHSDSVNKNAGPSSPPLPDQYPPRHIPSPTRPGPSSPLRTTRIPSPSSPIRLPNPPPPPPRKNWLSKSVIDQCHEVMRLPESERPGFEQKPLLDLRSYRDVP